MTSNQLTYWRNKEDVRHNTTQEQETARHNLTTEEVAKIKNWLDAQGLELRRAEDLTKLAELTAKYGLTDIQQLPQSVLDDMYGILDPKSDWKYRGQDVAKGFWEFTKQLRNIMPDIVKGAGMLF